METRAGCGARLEAIKTATHSLAPGGRLGGAGMPVETRLLRCRWRRSSAALGGGGDGLVTRGSVETPVVAFTHSRPPRQWSDKSLLNH